ncbi:serine carboxypeptidase-like 42 [Humulus lupulus]|uniref:serine carboxypeptidase-like 42 n=1 Tax=Humulus lupulus TaxID=3486 RepID=UPI002B408809|nr:serine carboxypeptidase-like 42 [Humulus lupulus]
MRAQDNLEFLLKWFERFPQYKGRDFYITGESYAGHYVPQLSQAIVKHNSATKEKTINLKGYMVGNALTDDHHDHLGLFQFMWSAGLISDETYKLLNLLCVSQPFIHSSSSCDKVLEIASEELGDIDPYSIYTLACHANGSQTNQLRKRKHRVGRISQKYDPCTEKHSTVYFNSPEVKRALHDSLLLGKIHVALLKHLLSDIEVELNNESLPHQSKSCNYLALLHMGSGILWNKYDFPVFLLSESSTKNIQEVSEEILKRQRSYTTVVAEFDLVMQTVKAGTRDSESCLKEETCLPLGGYSVWSSLPPLNISSSDQGKPIILTVASMDSASFFCDKSLIADSPISGMIALLAAVDALSHLEAFHDLNKQVSEMNLLFNLCSAIFFPCIEAFIYLISTFHV